MKLYNCFSILIVFCTFLLCLSCDKVKGPDNSANPFDSENVLIQVNSSDIVSRDILGFGWNVEGALPKLGTPIMEEWSKYFVQSEQNWVRMVLRKIRWEDTNDDDDPWTSPQNFKGFRWNHEDFDWKIIHLLDLCEANDIVVEMANWTVECMPWLKLEKGDDGFVSKSEAQLKADEFGENIAAMLYYLKTEANGGKGYDCIKYYAIWNEQQRPTGFIEFDYPGFHNLIHKSIREHLEFYDQECGTHISSQLKSFALESYPEYRISLYGVPASWKEMIGKGVLQYLEIPNGMAGEITDWPSADLYSDYFALHDYNSVFDYDEFNPSSSNQGTLKDRLLPVLERSLEQIEKYDTDGNLEPVILSELGSHSIGSENNSPDFSHALFVIETFVRSMNVGVQGGSLWSMNAHVFYNGISYPTCWWGESEPYGSVHPTSENYNPYKMFCHNVSRGDDVIASEVYGGSDKSKGKETYYILDVPRVFSCVLRNTQETKVFVVNDSYLSKKISIEGISSKESVEKDFISGDSYEEISHEVLETGSVVSDAVPARSIVVYKFK